MSTDERYDGEVHGLLATAFDDDAPLVNMVPGAVDGYRRHRRRTRVLGTAGGALALAGVAVAGTTLGSGTGSGAARQSAASGTASSAARQNPANGGTSSSPANAVDPACQGIYFRFGAQPHVGMYSADNATLSRVCTRDVAALRTAIPGATVEPERETLAEAVAHHEAQAGDRLPAGATAQTPLLNRGFYEVKVGGQSTHLMLTFGRHQSWGFNGCMATCTPNMKLADGTPATESPATSPDVGIDSLSIYFDAQHTAALMASPQNAPNEKMPFDFSKLVRSEPFAAAVAADVHDLNQLD
jgi:hypothetical protein